MYSLILGRFLALIRGPGPKAWDEKCASNHRASSSDRPDLSYEASHHTIASLSPRVFQEALSLQNTAVIVSYHPPIFKPLKSLTLSNPLQSSLLGCAASGISVYSPHTALDCIHGGINDWLAYGVLGCDAAEARLRLRDSNPAINVLGETKGVGAGQGRIVKVDESNLSIGALAARLKKFLNLEHGS